VCNDSGIADIIRSAGNASPVDLRAYTRSTSVPNLWVLPSGPGVDGVSGLFHSAALTDLLARCRNEFDLTLADSPPMSLYPDARMLGKISDGAVLVVRADRTSREELLRTCYQVLIEDGTNIQGTILNGYSIEPARYRAYTDSYRRYRGSNQRSEKSPR
jgi:Mrp family chromosome partitioning ATPase